MAHGGASNFRKAEACFRKAIRVAPNEPYPHYELGYTLAPLGRHKEALEEFEATDHLARGFFLVQTEAYLSGQFLGGAVHEDVLGKLRTLQRLMDTRAGASDDAVALSRQVISWLRIVRWAISFSARRSSGGMTSQLSALSRSASN